MKSVILILSIIILGHANMPILLSSSGVDAVSPRIQSDTNANAIAVWLEGGIIQAKYKPYGGNWGSIETVASSGVSDLHLVVDTSGNATVLWLEGGLVKTCTRSSGSWGSITILSSSGASEPFIATDKSDNLIAIWARGSQIESSTKLTGGSWPAAPDVFMGTQPKKPHLGIGDEGTVVAVWSDLNASINCILSVDKPLSGSWSSPVKISDSAHHCINPNVDVDLDGDAVAIWYRYDKVGDAFLNVHIQIADKSKNMAFDTPIDASSEVGAGDPSNLTAKIQFDDDGDAIAIWLFSDSLGTAIGSTIQPHDRSWTDSVLVTGSLYTLSLDFDVFRNGEGVICLIYPFYYSNKMEIWCGYTDLDSAITNTWTDITIVSSGDRNAYPAIACARKSSQLISEMVWQHYNGTNNEILSSKIEKDEIQPPTNLTVSQSSTDWGVFTEYYNTISWDPSPSNTVNQYIIYRDGVILSAVDKTVTQFIDHNQVQNGSVTYSVASQGANLIQSSRLSLHFSPTSFFESWW